MGYPDTFEGFVVEKPENYLEVKKAPLQPRPFGPKDIDIKIDCCGVCSSDIHTVSGGWGFQYFPLCVGHEIVGKAVRVGKDVTTVKVGDRVGTGAQIYSCGECRQCKADNETYCPKQRDTYGAKFEDSGIVSQGGYSSHVRATEHFTYQIPDAIASELAAPMLCAGITSYSPLVRNGAGPGKKVGVVGIGGLGHYALMFSVALGAETWAFSRTDAKKADCEKIGVSGFIATGEKGWSEPHKMTFDLIINSANSSQNFPLEEYLSLLDVHGKFVNVGLPEEAGVEVKAQTFLANGCFIGSSHLGSRKEVLEMLDLSAKKGINSWVETIPISAEGLKTAWTRLHNSDVRYRFTMVDYDKEFGTREYTG